MSDFVEKICCQKKIQQFHRGDEDQLTINMKIPITTRLLIIFTVLIKVLK